MCSNISFGELNPKKLMFSWSRCRWLENFCIAFPISFSIGIQRHSSHLNSSAAVIHSLLGISSLKGRASILFCHIDSQWKRSLANPLASFSNAALVSEPPLKRLLREKYSTQLTGLLPLMRFTVFSLRIAGSTVWLIISVFKTNCRGRGSWIQGFVVRHIFACSGVIPMLVSSEMTSLSDRHPRHNYPSVPLEESSAY